MARASEFVGFGRLEDFIAFARTGAKIQAAVELKKRIVSEKVHPGNTEEMKNEMDMYLLSALFTFKVGGEERKVQKVYMVGSAEGFIDDTQVDRQVANERLKLDYQRLKGVNIALEEKYF